MAGNSITVFLRMLEPIVSMAHLRLHVIQLQRRPLAKSRKRDKSPHDFRLSYNLQYSAAGIL